jgi:DNA primase
VNDFELETFFEMMGTRLGRADAGGNRSAKCPLAPWTHNKGRDKSPSLTAKAGEPALYKCWACQSAGTVFTLAKEYYQNSGDPQPFDYVKSLTKSHAWGKRIEYGSKFKRVGKSVAAKVNKEITEEKLAQYMDLVPEYAFERGITKEQVIKWEIGFDQSESRMIFTVRDYIGKLVGVSGRDVTGTKKPKYKHYPGFQKETVLYGEKFMDRLQTRAYLVEGFLDVLALERNGLKNVFATMGTSISEQQIKKLERWFKEIVFIPDVDDQGAGMQFVQTYGQKLAILGLKVGVAGVRKNDLYEQREKPRTWESVDYQFIPNALLEDKDPADLSKEELQVVLNQIEWIKLRAQGESSIFG